MNKQISVADTRDNLSAAVQEVEWGKKIEITRRGETVAVLISKREYDSLKRPLKKGDWGAPVLNTLALPFRRDAANER